ncbi:hypothetical protein OAE25_00060 [Verrucomicrobiales bacterium]|nr:hypothetical protein [Verrucomicrobiales bacterium]|tara:strand:+ start:277 stop:570 length:294 start_codon:yes stop_codon:yes gene_type:complete
MTTTTTIILINVGIIIFGTISYIIWNLLKKNEKQEDIINTQNNYIQTISTIMTESDKKIKEIDSKQIFQSDDEIGWFFSGIKEIQGLINEYNINHKP